MTNPADYEDYEAFKAAVKEDCRKRQKLSARLFGRLNVTEKDSTALGPDAGGVVADAILVQNLIRDCFPFVESCLLDGSWAEKTPEVGPLLLRVKDALAKRGVKAAPDKWLARVCHLDDRHRDFLKRYLALYEKRLGAKSVIARGNKNPDLAAIAAAAETELRKTSMAGKTVSSRIQQEVRIARQIDRTPTLREQRRTEREKGGLADVYDPDIDDPEDVTDGEYEHTTKPTHSNLLWLTKAEPKPTQTPEKAAKELEESYKKKSRFDDRVQAHLERVVHKKNLNDRRYFKALLAFWRAYDAGQSGTALACADGPMLATANLLGANKDTIYGHYQTALAYEYWGLLDVERFNEIVAKECGPEKHLRPSSPNGKVNDDGHTTPAPRLPHVFDGSADEFDKQFPLPNSSAAKAAGAGIIRYQREGKRSVDGAMIDRLGHVARLGEKLPSYNHVAEIVSGKDPTLYIDLAWIPDPLSRLQMMLEILSLMAKHGISEAQTVLDRSKEHQDRGVVKLKISGTAHVDFQKMKNRRVE